MRKSTAIAFGVVMVFLLAGGSASAKVRGAGHNAQQCPSRDRMEAMRCNRSYHLTLSMGAHGADAVWTSLNDAGERVGQKVKGGVSHFVYSDGRHARDVTAQLGGPGAFASIDPIGRAAGFIIKGDKTYPIYYDTRTSKKFVLPTPGVATGDALGGLVAVTTSDGIGWIWDPLTGGMIELGQFSTTSINALGTVVGHFPNGDLGFFTPDLHGGVQPHDVGMQGNLTHVNNANVATGYLRSGPDISPVSYDIDSGQLRHYEVPKGYRLASLTGIDDLGNTAYGNAFRSPSALAHSQSVAAQWPSPKAAGLIRAIYEFFKKGEAPKSDAVSAVNDLGLASGEVVLRKRDVAFVLTPPMVKKLRGLEDLALSVPVKSESQHRVAAEIFAVHGLLNDGRNKEACAKLEEVGGEFEEIARELEAQLSFFAAQGIVYYDDLAGGLYDVYVELGCSAERPRLIDISRLQSPYRDSPLLFPGA